MASLLRLLLRNNGNAKADVIVTPLRLEALAERRPAGPTVIAPSAAPADPGKGAVPVPCPLDRRQIGIVAARQLLVIPIPAPLADVALHVMQAPDVRGIAADLGSAIEGRTFLGTIVRPPLEVHLLATELVAKRGGGRRPGPASVFPLRLGGQPERVTHRKVT